MGARLGMAEELVELLLDTWRDRGLQPLGLGVRLRPTEPDDLGQEPLAQGVAPEDPVRRGPAGRRQLELAPLRERDEAIAGEAAEHLAGGLRAHAELPGDLRGGDPGTVAGHDPEREEVLLRGAGEVARRLVPALAAESSGPGHALDLVAPRAAQATPTIHAAASSAPSANADCGAPPAPTTSRNAVTGTSARSTPIVPPTNRRASGGRSSSRPRIAAWASHGSRLSDPPQSAE